MGDARPLYKSDELARAQERVARLEHKVTEMGVELLKTNSRLKAAHNQIRDQQQAIDKERANSARWHALLLQEKVRHVIKTDAA